MREIPRPRPARLAGLAALLLGACGAAGSAPEKGGACPGATAGGPVHVAGGTFQMGSDRGYREEGPAREVTVDDFWIGRTEVTVAEFAEFVAATGHVTVAEQPPDPADTPGIDPEARPELFEPGGAVFSPEVLKSGQAAGWWAYVPGASWRYPEGPDAGKAAPGEPVRQVAFADAEAYAAWAGGRLPDEAEWEYAALAGRPDSPGVPADPPETANTWQGAFPVADTGADGFSGVAPAGCFAANGYGLHDMLGNVWEWTSTSWGRASDSPQARVIKGGSFLCAANYCQRYRPAARQPQETGLGTSHVGFRVVYDEAPEAAGG